MNTAEFIQSFSPSQRPSGLEWFAKKIHDHTLLVKIARVVLGAFGVIALACAFTWGSILVGAIGIIDLVIVDVAYHNLSFYGIIENSMASHAYRAKSCEGGRLFYQGDVPVITLESDDPYKAGKAQGYLTAPQALKLARRSRVMAGMPEPSQVQGTLAQIKQQIPAEYVTEMQGVVDGINKWIGEQWFWSRQSKVSFDEILLSHLMPDSLYFHPSRQRTRQQIPQVACTVAIGKNRNSGLVFGRNMDWPSFGLAGTYSLVINRKYKGAKHSTVEIGIPGFCGTLTGMNEQGFSVAMNVCAKGHHNEGGIPAAFYNRKALESCASVSEGSRFISRNHPLGSYHFTMADAKEAKSTHFFQGKFGYHTTRKLEAGKPLITTNCSYGSAGSQYLHMHSSQERQAILDRLFSRAKEEIAPGEKDLEALIAHGLTLPPVNNVITTHTVEMMPGQKKMRAAFDNSYSASQPLKEIDTTELF